jgi:hypothetical protein
LETQLDRNSCPGQQNANQGCAEEDHKKEQGQRALHGQFNVQRQNSHTPDQKTLTAKWNCDGHPALCAVILLAASTVFMVVFYLSPDGLNDLNRNERT